MIEDLFLTPLKRIAHPKGDIYHAIKASSNGFKEFGEAYFSTIHSNEVKGWKKHTKMVLNLIVPVGSVKFVVFDDRTGSYSYKQYFEVILSSENYCRLTVPPGVWVAFQGKGDTLNLLLNIASIEHDPLESKTEALERFDYNWSF